MLHSLIHNVRVYAKYVKSKDNEVSDSLSRLDWVRFNKLKAKKNLNDEPMPVPEQIWPMSKIWL